MRIPQFSRFVVIGFSIALYAFSGVAVFGQEPFRDRGSAYVYYAGAAPLEPGASAYPVGIGAGGQVFLIRGLGAGADFGYYNNPSYHDDNFKILSANVGYHFKNRVEFHSVDPFVVGGWGLLSDDRSNNSIGFGGGGLDFWFNKHFGLRLEMRIYASDSCGCGLSTGRVGLLLR
jgi:hypothetical protein